MILATLTSAPLQTRMTQCLAVLLLFIIASGDVVGLASSAGFGSVGHASWVYKTSDFKALGQRALGLQA